MGASAVAVRGLWEEFRTIEDRTMNLKEALSRLRVVRGRRSVCALRDVSLDVGSGETIGLIGRNGSGKSTLLRCIAGILPPSRGEVLVGGTVASLIELGADFHPDLTGRENAFVTGALHGLTRRELGRRLDSIASFAGVDDVLDLPVRTYSTGLHIRLAFSLAIHIEPDVLLVDEVLAATDVEFRDVCVERLRAFGASGTAIVFVSHDLSLVEELCERCVLLDGGRVVADGPVAEVVDDYRQIASAE